MDEYGCFRSTKEDFDEIKLELDKHGTIVFAYSKDQIGCLVISLSSKFQVLGKIPFGGNPRGAVYVGIYGFGASHFSRQKIHADYFTEKLGIGQEEAGWLEELWDGLWT